MNPADYNIHDVNVREVPNFDRQGKAHLVTRVTMYVGDHGPFTQDFGPTTDRQNTPEAINAWKAEVVSRLMAVAC